MLSFANTALTSAEKITALNLSTARTLLDDGVANTKAILGAKNMQEAVALTAAQAQPAAEKAAGYGRSLYEISTQSKDDIAKLVERQFADYQKQLASLLEQATKNAPAGSEKAFAAASTAFDAMKNAAKQAAEVAEANIAKASKATEESRKKK